MNDRRSHYRLSPAQRAILAMGLLTIALMGLYPPWKATYHGEYRTTSISFAGYRWIHRPPIPRGPRGIGIHTERLLLQWLGTAIVTAGLIFIFQPARRRRDD